jgi:hypothetical protein
LICNLFNWQLPGGFSGAVEVVSGVVVVVVSGVVEVVSGVEVVSVVIDPKSIKFTI